MKLPSYQFLTQIGAAFTVVVSLGFVAYELKLSRELGMANLYVQTANMQLEHYLERNRDDFLNDAYDQMNEDPNGLSTRQLDRILWDTEVFFVTLDAQFAQDALGFTPESERDIMFVDIQNTFGITCLYEHWNDIKYGFNADFVAGVDKELIDFTPPECPW
ncbi:hypothetical protein OAT01_14720 [Pseudomonadales bacterium]|nr:hypothetical protein [Pseudomonadales bacterium]